MYVCHCGVVTDGEIRAAIAAGNRDFCALAEVCGTGVNCGGCLEKVAELLEEQGYPNERPGSARELRTLLDDVSPHGASRDAVATTASA